MSTPMTVMTMDILRNRVAVEKESACSLFLFSNTSYSIILLATLALLCTLRYYFVEFGLGDVGRQVLRIGFIAVRFEAQNTPIRLDDNLGLVRLRYID